MKSKFFLLINLAVIMIVLQLSRTPVMSGFQFDFYPAAVKGESTQNDTLIYPTPTPRWPGNQDQGFGQSETSNCIPNALIILNTKTMLDMQKAIDNFEGFGGCMVHIFPTRALIGFVQPESIDALINTSEVAAIFQTEVPDNVLLSLSFESQVAAHIWNHNFVNPEPPPTPEPGAPTPHPLVGDVLSVEIPPNPAAEQDSAAPGYYQISEFMTGKVAVGIILPESTGSGENWSLSRMNQVVAEIQSSMNWWSGINPAGNLSFYYDIRFQVPTQYEPINLSPSDDDLWISESLSWMGFPGTSWVGQAYDYLNYLRSTFGTDWVVMAFVVDSLNDPDGSFSNGYFGYTYGFLVVMTYDNDGWGIDRMDSVFAHEFGHNFGAADEYCAPGYACCWGGGQSGYLGIPNVNCEAGCDHNSNGICDGNDSTPNSGCQDCPTCVETTCIMRSGSVNSGIDTPSREQVGMRDVDGDGKLDPVDTIPVLTLDPWPPEIIYDNTPTYLGSAEDIPFSSPIRPSVTINNITAVEYELDYSGNWLPAQADDGIFDETTESYSFTMPQLSDGPHSVFIRAFNRWGNESVWLYDTFTVSTNYTLVVNKTGTGSGTVTSNPTGINCGSDCTEAYAVNTSVTLTASAATGSTFTGWSGGGCSGTGACTVTMTADTTVTANFNLVPASDLIFADGFESGNLSAWTSCTTDGGDLSVKGSAALVGSYGLEVLFDDNNAKFCNDQTPNAEKRYRARFYFHPHSIGMTSGDTHVFFQAIKGTSPNVVRLEFRKYSANYQVRAGVLTDGSVWTSSSWITISNAKHTIEFDWKAATGAGVNNGYLILWIDGIQKANLTGVDNDTHWVDQMRFGPVGGIDSGTRGAYYLDGFESRKKTYIGP